ncbi:MAG: lipoprotein transmembrane [Erythrobacter sp. RIFCSPHIGHO2_12_FULL_63_10]|nr:MAG: lipoprotein transmembrane [Erythrobacter sp. RIFCSPHIGHO2_12_FULL_63_10]
MKIRIAPRLMSLRLAGITLLAAALAACATPFKADVSRFDAQMPAPQGETFAVVADDPALAGGLEFALYADEVEAAMEKLGYVQASPEAATMLVRFDYGVDDGRERIRSTGTGFYDPYWGPWHSSRFYGSHFYGSRFYGRYGLWNYGYYDPWFGGSDVRSYTVYTSGIELKIDRAATGERLFEGKAQAVSTSNRLQYLVPNLVDAMFTGFPGNSGETVRITIKPEDQKVKRSNKDY